MKVNVVTKSSVSFTLPDGEFQIMLANHKPKLSYWFGRYPVPFELKKAIHQTFAILKPTPPH